MGFWQEHCETRASDLLHRHASDCTDGHIYDQCCECGLLARDWVPSLTPPVPVVRNVTRDHRYVSTIAGFCAECSGVEDDHPIFGTPDEMTGCDVDHKSLTSERLLGDGGWVWSSCPRCDVMVEPKMALGNPVGAPYGPGRSWYGDGALSPRDKARLTLLIDHTVRREQPAGRAEAYRGARPRRSCSSRPRSSWWRRWLSSCGSSRGRASAGSAFHVNERRMKALAHAEANHDAEHKGFGWKVGEPDRFSCHDATCVRNPKSVE